MRSRRTVVWTLLLLAVVVVGIIVAVVLLAGSHDSPATAPEPEPTGQVSVQVDWGKEEPNARAAIGRLASAPRSVLAAEALDEFGDRLDEAIPPGSSFEPVAGSWAPDKLGGATMLVEARLAGRAPVTYAVVMALRGGQWKVLATIPVTR